MIAAAGIVVLAGAIAYHNSLAGPFVYDDQNAIVGNRTIRHLWPIWPVLSPPHRGETVSGRPLLNLSLAINYAISGLKVWSYHATNLLIHMAAALLLLGILRRTFLLPALRDRFARAALPLALASTLLWMLHPLQTESVTYIVQRAESLAGLFYLLTLYCVIRGAGEKGDCLPKTVGGGHDIRDHWSRLYMPGPHVPWYAAAVLACLLGTACKETLVTAPLVVLLYDRTFLSTSLADALRQRWRLYLALAATWGPLACLVWSTGLITHQSDMGAPDAWSYARTQPGVILHYLRLSVWPNTLCMSYEWPVASGLGDILPGAIVVGVLLAATIWGLIGRKAWGFAGAWFFLILAPTSSILPLNQLVHDHRTYLSLAAEAVLLVAGAYVLWNRLLPRPVGFGRRAAVMRWALPVAVCTAAVLACGYTTAARNSDFRSPLAIWQDGVNKNPHSVQAHTNLGLALADAGRTAEAIAHYDEALRLKPGYAKAHNNLGAALGSLGRVHEAIEHCREAVRLKPDSPEAYNNLGNALILLGRTDEAVAQYRQALRLEPDYPQAHCNLANVLAKSGATDEATAHYQEALRLEPDFTAALTALAWLLAARQPAEGRDPAEALRLARRACELTGQEDALCLDTLAVAYAAAGRFADAVATAQRAAELAQSAGQRPLAQAIRRRLELYRSGQPYREGIRD